MCVDRFHIVSLFLSNPCTPSTLSKEAFVYFVCPTEIPQPPFAWKYYRRSQISRIFCHFLKISHAILGYIWVFFSTSGSRRSAKMRPATVQVDIIDMRLPELGKKNQKCVSSLS